MSRIVGRGHGALLPSGPVKRSGPIGGEKNARSQHSRATTLCRLFGLLRIEIPKLMLATVASSLGTLSGLLAMCQLRPIVNHYETILRQFSHPARHLTDPRVTSELAGAQRSVLLFVGFVAAFALNDWLQGRLTARLSAGLIAELRERLFASLHRLPVHFFDRTPQGELISRVIYDVESVGTALSSTLPRFVVSFAGAVGTMVMLVHIEWRLALVILLTVPVVGLASRAIALRTRHHFRRQQDRLGELNALVEEALTGQQVMRLFGAEAHFVERFDRANIAYRDAANQAQFYGRILGPLNNMFGNLGYALTALVGVWLVVHHGFDVGGVAACLGLALQFSRPISELAGLGNLLMSAAASAERVFLTLDEPDESETDGHLGFPLGPTRVELIRACFSYVPGRPVLKNVSLVAEPGSLVAIVGPTGAGKTTIANLLTRFYEIDSGSIQISGVDLRQIEKRSLRSQVAVVLQEPRFFSVSIRENIRFGRLDATDDEVEAAAQAAEADSFIRALPDGYNTILHEDAGNLSQGQCQLLAIARALVSNPRLLVLDEATSNVDPRTDLHIQQAMRRLMQGRTSFVIAHRLSTIRDADLIAVLDQGRLVELGDHPTLVAQGGLYATLCQLQEQDTDVPDMRPGGRECRSKRRMLSMLPPTSP